MASIFSFRVESKSRSMSSASLITTLSSTPSYYCVNSFLGDFNLFTGPVDYFVISWLANYYLFSSSFEKTSYSDFRSGFIILTS